MASCVDVIFIQFLEAGNIFDLGNAADFVFFEKSRNVYIYIQMY